MNIPRIDPHIPIEPPKWWDKSDIEEDEEDD
jgi:hypothetical protein